jgi:putative FmdB family regulatory protein
MILFSYKCNKCTHFFSKLYSKDASELFHCPNCGSPEVNSEPPQALSDYLKKWLENNRRS